MELRRIIRTDIAASALAHLSLVALIIVISEVHPFHTPPIETVSVDIVSANELKDEAKEPAPEVEAPKPDVPLPDLSVKDKAAAASPPQQPPAQQQASVPPPAPKQPPSEQPSPAPIRHEANTQPQPQVSPPPQPAPQPPPPRQVPAFRPPEPDITVKYGVMLGLPAELPPPEPKETLTEPLKETAKETPGDDGGDGKDALAAKLPMEVIAEFRRHLKSCAKLPDSIAPTDNLRIRLRAVMTTDGMLARPPILIEAPPSAKGPLLVKSAMKALEACQPYKMLPADKYDEWKVMDLPFTPRDFGGS